MNKYLKFSNYASYFRNRFVKHVKSYSQSAEDLILNNFFKDKNYGVYVDVGANDPKKFNNTYFFYKKGWRGLNIEPNIDKYVKLKKIRKNDVNLNIGVGSLPGKLDFYDFKEDTLSTFSKDIAEDYQKMGHRVKGVKSVEVCRLDSIFDKHLNGKKIDFITIDTEGNDLDVLKSNDWSKYRPSYLVVETLEYKIDDSAKKLNDIFDEYLKSISYMPVIDTGINTIYADSLK
ncbi:MAG: FkbM family methyltransferase [Candidatus Falkowbacteria bacterium]